MAFVAEPEIFLTCRSLFELVTLGILSPTNDRDVFKVTPQDLLLIVRALAAPGSVQCLLGHPG